MTLCAFSLTGCAHKQPRTLLSEAEAAMDRGMTAEARALCDEAIARAEGTGKLSATDIAKISIIYIKVADDIKADDGETMGLAIKAYEQAMKQAPDSVAAYYASVSDEDTRHVKMLQNVVRGLELPDSAIREEEEHAIIATESR